MPLFTRPGFRIGLRPVSLDDIDTIMTWVNDPEVVRNFATMGQITREQELAFLERMIASKEDRLYAIVTVDDPERPRNIGNAGIHKIYWPARNGRLGVVIGSKSDHGRGYGQEAMALLLALGFEEIGLHKLWLVHYAENTKMRHLAEKLGFQQEGLLRDEYFCEGHFHDMFRHAILAPDYKNHKERGV